MYEYDVLCHHGVKGMKWGVRRAVRGHGGPGRYLGKQRQLDGDKRDLKALNEGKSLSKGLTKNRQEALNKRDKELLEKRIAKNEGKLKDKSVKELSRSEKVNKGLKTVEKFLKSEIPR